MTNLELYERDFAAWSEQTAEAIRHGRWDEIDQESLAEEVASLARKDARELKNRLKVLIMHLLKYQFQPDKRTSSWRSTIFIQRSDLEGLLEQSPSLKHKVDLEAVYQRAQQMAAIETGMLFDEGSFPKKCPWTMKQILDGAFLPGE